ncbi:MAG: ABC transporter ATP-binding protein [Candidatus Hodarchaeales archaeon]|jgi:ABC-type lipoprotein export system ATPase subunit
MESEIKNLLASKESVGIKTFDLLKVYQDPAYDTGFIALQGLELDIRAGSLTSFIGPSGSGKSTLLNLLGAIIQPTAGEIKVGDVNVHLLNRIERDYYRRNMVGFLWQQPEKNLIYDLNAIDNIRLAQKIGRSNNKNGKNQILDLLTSVGLESRKYHKPSQLSGGEVQRLSLAVALANQPKILLADEPTGELDSTTTLEIIQYLKDLNKNLGITVVVVTHDPQFAKLTTVVHEILDGRINVIKKLNEENNILTEAKEHEELLFVDQYGNVRIPTFLRKKLRIDKYLKLKIGVDGRAYIENFYQEEEK